MVNNEEVDLTLAIQLQAQFEEEFRGRLLKEEEDTRRALETHDAPRRLVKGSSEPEQQKLSVSLVDPSWELIDPNPDIHMLFLTFNDQFFWGRLTGVEVKWSPRMTLCAGVCSYEGRGGLCSVRLSIPLLKLRPRKDLLETLLHEMIHAYLFVTANNRDRDGHGPEFHKHMFRINRIAGTNITVYHSFHDEVNVYRQHVWQCSGPCRKRPPYYGLVKRSMNRAPSERDLWWSDHQRSCGGMFNKIHEPEGYGEKKRKKIDLPRPKDVADIRKYIFVGKGSNLKSDKDNSLKGDPPTRRGISPSSHRTQNTVSSDGGPVAPKSLSHSGSQQPQNKTVGLFKTGGTQGPFRGHTPQPGRGYPDARRGGSGSTRGAMRGSGSRTVVIHGKTKTATYEAKAEDSEKSVGTSTNFFVPFGGAGHALGGSVSRDPQRSRQQWLNSIDRRNDTTERRCLNENKVEGGDLDKVQDSAENDAESMITCPLCNVNMPSINMDEHIVSCIGDLPPFEESDSECEGSCQAIEQQSSPTNASAGLMPHLFPCPLCDRTFPEDEINHHVNQHFS